MADMAARAVIFGCAGTELGEAERTFFREADPWGFILFARNVVAPEQVRRLNADLREAVGRDAPILVDQEGGRVARLRGPAWRDWPDPLDEVAPLPPEARARVMELRYRVIAGELRAVGIDANCAPVADVLQPETHPFLRSRCYGGDPAEVAAIGRAVAEGLLAGGVLPVVKHAPGHGRARADSHKALPRVAAGRAEMEASDLVPFVALADLPMAMTAHVVYEAIDPERPGTLSPAVIALIRERIGFDGLLMTDDINMGALAGPVGGRARDALAAGCDVVLHCSGDAAEMAAVAAEAPLLAGRAAARAEAALARRQVPADIDVAELFEALAEVRSTHA